MKKRITNFEDLEVYQQLCNLHLELNDLTFKFPEFEIREIGSELRRVSNSAPASIAEGYSNKHVKSYLDKINQALGEVRQTKHYLNIAFKKRYIEQSKYEELLHKYEECIRMLKALQKTINFKNSRKNTFTKNQYPDNYHL